jgi:hypothetical protein
LTPMIIIETACANDNRHNKKQLHPMFESVN